MVLTINIIIAIVIIVVVFFKLKKRELRFKKKLAELDNEKFGTPTYYTDSTRSKLERDFKRIQRKSNGKPK